MLNGWLSACQVWAFSQGLAALNADASLPHKIQVAFDQDQAEGMKQMLHQSPREFGSVGTLDLAAGVAYQPGISGHQVSGETIRQTLERQGIGWRRVN